MDIRSCGVCSVSGSALRRPMSQGWKARMLVGMPAVFKFEPCIDLLSHLPSTKRPSSDMSPKSSASMWMYMRWIYATGPTIVDDDTVDAHALMRQQVTCPSLQRLLRYRMRHASTAQACELQHSASQEHDKSGIFSTLSKCWISAVLQPSDVHVCSASTSG